MPSIQRQIHLRMLLALAAAAAVLMAWGYSGIRILSHDYVLTRLQHDADSLASALERDDAGHWSVTPGRMGTVYERVFSGHYYQVVTPDGELRSRSLWDLPVQPPRLEPGAQQETLGDGARGERWLGWSRGIVKSGDRLTLWVAEDIAPLQRAQRRSAGWALALLAAIVGALLLAQRAVVKRGFARLDPLRDSIRSLRGGTTDRIDGDIPLEVAPLAEEINRLLGQLQGKVSRSRHAMGNLAHEMKRPLHRLRSLAAALDGDGKSAIEQQLQQLEHLVSRELKRARIVGVATPGRHTDLDRDLPPLLDALATLYPGCDIQTRYPAGLVLPQDRDDMLELLGNLLDNACKHGGGRVDLVIGEQPAAWHITVSDDGPGLPDGAADIFRRGRRLDESGPGHGLGLPICSDIVAEYEGSIGVLPTSDRGLTLSVELPHTTE